MHSSSLRHMLLLFLTVMVVAVVHIGPEGIGIDTLGNVYEGSFAGACWRDTNHRSRGQHVARPG